MAAATAKVPTYEDDQSKSLYSRGSWRVGTRRGIPKCFRARQCGAAKPLRRVRLVGAACRPAAAPTAAVARHGARSPAAPAGTIPGASHTRQAREWRRGACEQLRALASFCLRWRANGKACCRGLFARLRRSHGRTVIAAPSCARRCPRQLGCAAPPAAPGRHRARAPPFSHGFVLSALPCLPARPPAQTDAASSWRNSTARRAPPPRPARTHTWTSCRRLPTARPAA